MPGTHWMSSLGQKRWLAEQATAIGPISKLNLRAKLMYCLYVLLCKLSAKSNGLQFLSGPGPERGA